MNERPIPESWPCLSRSYVLELLILIERSLRLSPRSASLLFEETGTQFNRVIEFLCALYSQRLSVETHYTEFATNRTSLTALFRKNANASPMAYLNDLRLQIAISHLSNTKLPIHRLAERVGIRDLGHRESGRTRESRIVAYPIPKILA